MPRRSSERWLQALLVFLLAFVGVLVWWVLREPSIKVAVEALSFAWPTHLEEGLAEAPGREHAGDRVQLASLHAQGRVIIADVAEQARRLHAPDGSADEDLQILQSLLAVFRRSNEGSNPSAGLNEEFVDALRGKNAKRLAVLPPDLPFINEQGQLLDRWGSPYYFHPISREVVSVRTAGPDRKLWTADDVLDASDE